MSLAATLAFATIVAQLRGDPEDALGKAETVSKHLDQFGFSSWWGRCTDAIGGWALVALGEGPAALDEIHGGITYLESTGIALFAPYLHGLLAEAQLRLGGAREGYASVQHALTIADRTGERWWAPELLRLRGEISLAISRDDQEAAERDFTEALARARSMEARSLELRAAVSLGRLWHHQRKPAEARNLLAPIYNWFTEGFDTADLKEAKALLDELS